VIAAGLVFWRLAALMAVGSILGGWAGARLAQRIGQNAVRWVVVAVGLITGAATLIR